MVWTILITAIVVGTGAAVVAYKKGYKDGYKESYWGSIDLC